MEELLTESDTNTLMVGLCRTAVGNQSSGVSRLFLSDFSATRLVGNDWPMSAALRRNIETIDGFEHLPDDWNNNGAVPFEKSMLDKAKKIMKSLNRQPLIFPTARQSVQFEYHKENGDYLEFEVFNDRITVYSEITGREDERELNSSENINGLVEDFYA